MKFVLSLPFAAALLAANLPPGDSARGEQVFRNEGCVGCHAVNGKGGTVGPDLGKRIDRDFTPSILAATMWNHAPAMWAAIRKQGVVTGSLSPESAADLFAFFYSTRFFEKPGDAARGKALFASKHCAGCHGVTSSNFAGAPPVATWQSLGHPLLLAGNMWNHASAMRAAFGKKGIPWQPLTAQDLGDILVYVRNLPETRGHAAEFRYAPAAGGEPVYQAKCAGCHKTDLGIHQATLTDIAAAMWNHAPRMQPAPALTTDEMRAVLGYVWARQFYRSTGSAARGRRVFEQKNCAACHGQGGGAPNLAARKPFSEITMISALWEHGPRMQERMNEKRLPWPRFEGGQMSDLIAYLNSLQ